MYINEVKRDKETLKKISEFQSSIENLVSQKTILVLAFTTWQVCLALLGEGRKERQPWEKSYSLAEVTHAE